MATSGVSEDIGREITNPDPKMDLFDELPDDLVVDIVSKLGATASCPSDFFSLILTCKRMKKLGFHPKVLAKVSPNVFTWRGTNWCQNAAMFLNSCALASNLDAIYTLGMIIFYCVEQKESREFGKSLIEKAAFESHPDAIYSLSIMTFNGSRGADNYLEVGYMLAKQAAHLGHHDAIYELGLCFEEDHSDEQAAHLGHIDAIYELGLCFQEGHNDEQNVAEQRRLIFRARAQLLTSVLPLSPTGRIVIPILKTPSLHPVHRFLIEWFGSRGGVPGEGRRLCSRVGCGLPETCACEFRRCPICLTVSYCSLACQIVDWRRHCGDCTPKDIDEEGVNDDNADGDVDGEGNEEEEVREQGQQKEVSPFSSELQNLEEQAE